MAFFIVYFLLYESIKMHVHNFKNVLILFYNKDKCWITITMSCYKQDCQHKYRFTTNIKI